MTFTPKLYESINFEIGVLIVYIVTLLRIIRNHWILANLKKNYGKIIILKNYEVQRLKRDIDDEDEVEEVKTGKREKRKVSDMQSEEELKKKQTIKYKEIMAKIEKQLPKCYINCDHFRGLNKVVFLWLIIFQLMQTMGFNGVFDLPQLVAILFIVGFYAYRNAFPIFFALLNFGLCYYIQIALMFKLAAKVALRVPFVQDYLDDNEDATTTIIVRVLFGLINKTGKRNI
jgi:hypothetical protein